MKKPSGNVAILISCSDRRLAGTVPRVKNHLLKTYPLRSDSIYRIKVPGPDGRCVGKLGETQMHVLRKDIELLVERGKPSVIVIVGHLECAGHPVEEDEHRADITSAVGQIHDWVSLPVIGLHDTKHSDHDWELNEIMQVG